MVQPTSPPVPLLPQKAQGIETALFPSTRSPGAPQSFHGSELGELSPLQAPLPSLLPPSYEEDPDFSLPSTFCGEEVEAPHLPLFDQSPATLIPNKRQKVERFATAGLSQLAEHPDSNRDTQGEPKEEYMPPDSNYSTVNEGNADHLDAGRKDFRSMAAIVVNHCVQQGRLPLFGSDAIHLILRVVEQAIRDPHVISSLGVYAHADDVTRWQAVLQHADLSRLEIETEQSGAAMASNYLNRKISERWSCKAKSLLKLIRPITSTPLRGSAIHDVRVLRAIGKWAGVSVGEVTLRQCVLGIWRANKMLEGVSLKSDIQRARERVKGHSRIHTEFELARGMWEAELRSLEAEAAKGFGVRKAEPSEGWALPASFGPSGQSDFQSECDYNSLCCSDNQLSLIGFVHLLHPSIDPRPQAKLGEQFVSQRLGAGPFLVDCLLWRQRMCNRWAQTVASINCRIWTALQQPQVSRRFCMLS